MPFSSIRVLSSYAREMVGTQVNSCFLFILAKIRMCQISVKVASVEFWESLQVNFTLEQTTKVQRGD